MTDFRDIIDDKLYSFQLTGIPENYSEKDKKLFEEIKDIIYEKIIGTGHNYKLENFEFRASSLGKCSRKIIIEKHPKFLNEHDWELIPIHFQEELTGNKRGATEFGPHIAGQVIHEAIQKALETRILSVEEEIVKKIGKGQIIGHYDILMEFEDGEKVVIDIKSTSSQRKYLPKEIHLRQLLTYQGMLGGIKGALLYVNRNTWEMTFISQEFATEKFSNIVTKVVKLIQSEENKELPPPIPEFSYECISLYSKCPFYNICFKEDNDRLGENI